MNTSINSMITSIVYAFVVAMILGFLGLSLYEGYKSYVGFTAHIAAQQQERDKKMECLTSKDNHSAYCEKYLNDGYKSMGIHRQ